MKIAWHGHKHMLQPQYMRAHREYSRVYAYSIRGRQKLPKNVETKAKSIYGNNKPSICWAIRFFQVESAQVGIVIPYWLHRC